MTTWTSSTPHPHAPHYFHISGDPVTSALALDVRQKKKGLKERLFTLAWWTHGKWLLELAIERQSLAEVT